MLRKRLTALFVFMAVLLVLGACGETTKEDVVKKLSNKWVETKGYELDAEMMIQTGGEPRKFDVNVWHTKPDFYRVKVTQNGESDSQMIVRNEDGVFVVTPALKKTYKFQSEWPKQNSQAYLIGALAEDLAADKNLVMREESDTYVFETVTRNNQKNVMPYQIITVDKKTMLPKEVSVLNEAKEEQIHITFKNVKLNVKHGKDEYAVEQFTEPTNGNDKKANNDDDKKANNDDDKKVGAEVEDKSFQTHYPVIKWEGTKQTDEKIVEEGGVDRVILTYEGDKSFTLMQQPALAEQSVVPVFAPGDPADLGFTIGAITDSSLSWEMDGVSFFLATNNLTRSEMIEVAASISAGSIK